MQTLRLCGCQPRSRSFIRFLHSFRRFRTIATMFADPGIEHDYVYADFLFVINLLRANVALVRYLFEILQFFFSQFTLTYAICNIVIAK